MYSYDDEDMLKVGANSLGSERVSSGLLEHYGHYVVPNVPLSQQLVIEKQGIFRGVTTECKSHTKDLVRSIYWH